MSSQEFPKNPEFLQSEEWRKFQESTGRRTFHVDLPHPNPLLLGEGDFSFWANIIEHTLPIVGSYFYIPRGPIICHPDPAFAGEGSRDSSLKLGMTELLDLAKRENAGWIRIDPENEEILEIIGDTARYNGNNLKIVKAPRNMQPKEVFAINVTKPEEQLLAEMKPKTRYNINLAIKKGVKVFGSSKQCHPEFISGSDLDSQEMLKQVQHDNKYYINEFLRLVKTTAKRKKVRFHPENYYRKMIEMIPGDILKLYCAEYDNKVIAANLVVFHGDTATYLHGATDDEYRNVMAPYLLHWQTIKDAKKAGCERYDMGGVKTISPLPPTPSPAGRGRGEGDWAGVTKFKLGFSSNTKPVEFAGSYDIVLNPIKYNLYRLIQKIKGFVK